MELGHFQAIRTQRRSLNKKSATSILAVDERFAPVAAAAPVAIELDRDSAGKLRAVELPAHDRLDHVERQLIAAAGQPSFAQRMLLVPHFG